MRFFRVFMLVRLKVMKATSSLFTCLQFDRIPDRIQCNPNFFLRRENTRCVTSTWTAAAAFLNPVFTRRWSRWYTVVIATIKEWRYVFYWERWIIWLTTKSSFSFTFALNRLLWLSLPRQRDPLLFFSGNCSARKTSWSLPIKGREAGSNTHLELVLCC